MLRNYLAVATRSLRRHFGYTAINVVGLAVGIAVCLVITLYIRHELSYDRFHADADRIVRVTSDWGDFSVPATNPPMARALQAEWSDVPMARLTLTEGLVAYGERRFQEDDVFFADPGFFDVFSFDLVRGHPDDVLTRPYTVVLTTELAEKYFPNQDPVGKTIEVDNQFELEVTGVIEPAPAASHFRYDLLASWATIEAVLGIDTSNNWGSNFIYTYLKVPPARSIARMEAELPDIRAQYGGEDLNTAALALQPITRIHLHSHHDAELEANSRAVYVWMFGIIAAVVLVLACVNFTNLATARALERAREVGVRKAVGAGRGQLIGRFLGEAFVMAGGALLVALALAAAAMPLFRTLTGTEVEFDVLTDPFALVALLGITVIAALGAGSYPAFILSRFDPVRALRGRSREAGHGAALRKGLVVFQFAAAVCLIAGTIVAARQLDYLRSAHLGFDKERVLTVSMPIDPTQDGPMAEYAAWRQELQQVASVASVSIASEELPTELLNGATSRLLGSGVPFDSLQSFRVVNVGPDFFEAMGVELVAGRTFTDSPADTSSFVMNRAAYEQFARRMPEQPAGPDALVGQELEVLWTTPVRGPLVGVVEDFHMSTLHQTIEPIVFFRDPDRMDTFYIRVAAEDIGQALGAIEATWQRIFPDWPFLYQFADQAFDAAYRAEQRLGRLFGIFAGLAIVIACLGLFGLAAYAAQQRTKEIGIRKALGASVANIVGLLSKDFATLVGGAIVVALPIAYVVLDRWLGTFAYRVDVGVVTLLLAGSGALLLALLTVSYHALRAARLDPAMTLRDE